MSTFIILIYILALAHGVTSQDWHNQYHRQQLQPLSWSSFDFPAEADMLRFNVTCNSLCDVYLMNPLQFSDFLTSGAQSSEFQKLSTFNAILTFVNMKTEKHSLVVKNDREERIVANVVISKQVDESTLGIIHFGMIGSYVFYTSILSILIYLFMTTMNKF